MGEMQIENKLGENIAIGKNVTSLDSIEAPIRWQRKNLVDNLYNGQAKNPDLAQLISNTESEHTSLIDSIVSEEIFSKRKKAKATLAKAEERIKSLPKPI